MKPKSREPIFATQLDMYGQPEKIDITKYSVKLICKEPGCISIRYIQPQDKGEVSYCKPHARKARLASRARRAKKSRAVRGVSFRKDSFLSSSKLSINSRRALYEIALVAFDKSKIGKTLQSTLRPYDYYLINANAKLIDMEVLIDTLKTGTFKFPFGTLVTSNYVINSFESK